MNKVDLLIEEELKKQRVKKSNELAVISIIINILFYAMSIFMIDITFSSDTNSLGWVVFLLLPVIIITIIAQLMSIYMGIKATKMYMKEKEEVKNFGRKFLAMLNIINIFVTIIIVIVERSLYITLGAIVFELIEMFIESF